jgi:hypothetical protein
MNRARRPPLQHPLASAFDRAVESFSAALSPGTTRHYHGTARNFLSYLGANHPDVQRLDQLRRDPHILGWTSRLRSQVRPLSTASYINRLIALRSLLNELAWTEQRAELARLIRREDFPRPPQKLPRPLTAQQDQLLVSSGNSNWLVHNLGILFRSPRCPPLAFDLDSTGYRRGLRRQKEGRQGNWGRP